MRPDHKCWLDLIDIGDIGGLHQKRLNKYWRSGYESSRLIMTHLHMLRGKCSDMPLQDFKLEWFIPDSSYVSLGIGSPHIDMESPARISFRNAFIEHLYKWC